MDNRNETLKEALAYLLKRCDDFMNAHACNWRCSECRVNIRYKELAGIDLCEAAKYTDEVYVREVKSDNERTS